MTRIEKDAVPTPACDTLMSGHTAVVYLPLELIRVEARFRRELGDIASLAASIAEVGLLQHPVVVTPDYRLIAGQRRLAAFKQLERTHIPAHVVPLADILRGEFDENAFRADFSFSETVAIKRVLEDRERHQARERQRLGGQMKAEAVGNLPKAAKGRINDKIAKAAGIGRRTLEKAEAVVTAAEHAPEQYAAFVEKMDSTRRVDGVYRKLIVAQKAAAIRAAPPPMPGRGPYRVIVADPPWAYDKRPLDPSRRGVCPYPQMSIEEICALPVASLAHADAILWLWTTNAHLEHTYFIARAWGFEPKTLLTWMKNKMGTGDWLRGQTEHCLMAVRGNPVVQLSNQTTALQAPAGEHSAKPQAFYDLVESLCPAPRYCELFQRKPRPNWDGHGDEA